MLNITNLSAKIGSKSLLTNINFSAQPGTVTGLIGPNGAGKSTLLKCISQDIAINQGNITLHLQPLNHWPRLALAQHLGVLSQHASLSFPFSAKQVIEMGLYPLSLSQQQGQQVITQQLAQLDITHLSEHPYPQLSGGEKQRVQLARVLTQLSQASQAPLLLLDEPTSALDLAQQHNVLTLSRALAIEHNYIVVVVLHDLNQASRYCDQLLLLKQGKIYAKGTPPECLTAANIEDIWHYQAQFVKSPDGQGQIIV